MSISVLRLGHRYARDKRMSTHICLTARALGADRVIFDVADSSVKESVDEISCVWGGDFRVEFIKNWRNVIKDFMGTTVHLTMYGICLNECVDKISQEDDVLVVVGGAKVPSDVYHMVDFNIAVGHQPHSEVAALAVFLDRVHSGRELDVEFNGKRRIIPQEKGKKVEDLNKPE